ncbi:TetR/AcrR family transcriptional regulator [Aquabacterium sp. A7-Y]|uniref:TetR/AcrR family transcriptional regulator n=1 Tax=Aquabacterium sp. A7-Y TaxID=1349605 RepID=UPI00223D4E23|nr:TetR/AcrR family transcriptional regulator [Aquabacterium sp. A7-Y]MCW7537915.1 TetR/AcrR family transcriptional regulator [Aquabacterium sp. A7-Y]
MSEALSDPAPSRSAPRRRYLGVSAAERQQQRRRRLVEAGIAVFGARGFHAATVREVCMQARLTERYFYESFKGVAPLFVAVYGELMAELKQRTVGALEARADAAPLAAAEAGLRVFFEYVREDPQRARIVLVHALSLNEEVLQLCKHALEEYTVLAREVIARSAARGEPALLAAGLIGLNIHVATAWLLEDCRTPIDRVVETTLMAYRALEPKQESSGEPARAEALPGDRAEAL